MRRIFTLLTSRFAIAKTLVTVFATALATQAGVLFDNAFFGVMSLTYSLAYLLHLIAKSGGDSVFSRRLKEKGNDPAERATLAASYLIQSLVRLAGAAALLAVAAFWSNSQLISPSAVPAAVLLACAMTSSNILRISNSPDFQIGIDYSTLTVATILAEMAVPGVLFPFLAVFSIGLLAFHATVVLGTRPALAGKRQQEAKLWNGPYFFSELMFFTMGLGVPIMLASTASDTEIGVIRSIERVSFSGLFILFVMNNRLFNDLSRGEDNPRIDFGRYVSGYCIPSAIFYVLISIIIIIAAYFGFIPNIVNYFGVYILYTVAYLINAASGPVNSYMNFLGQERYTLLASMAGASTVVAATLTAYVVQNPYLIVAGSALGLAVTNLIQIRRLRTYLKLGQT